MERICKVCGNTHGNREYVAREMMFGMRDEFLYFQCSCCGCLQIAEVPKDMSKYYPSDRYPSYWDYVPQKGLVKNLKNLIKKCLSCAYFCLRMPVQKLPHLRNFSYLKVLRSVKKTAAVLDVGCGIGAFLQQMNCWGFKNLTGIDPFIEKDILYPSGVRVWKSDVYNYSKRFVDNQEIANKLDLIMLHHSFEHMDNPHGVFEQLYRLLDSDGQILIRIPIADSFAWRKYGVNWFQLDAPRHFFLHTIRSISFLAKQHGFILKQVYYDSTEAQFLNSEKYGRDITLLVENEIFSRAYIKSCQKQAKWLNKMKDGDQACFVLRKQKEE